MPIGFIQRFMRRQDGATAVEFSLIAFPLIFLLFGLIEICMIFTKQGTLEYATLQAARQIRTGQIQQGGEPPEDAFREALCEAASIMIRCGDIDYEVQAMDDFAQANEQPPPEFDEDGNMENQAFDPGGSSGVVFIRTVHRHPIVTPFMKPIFASPGSNDSYLVMTTVVLRAEPYEFN